MANYTWINAGGAWGSTTKWVGGVVPLNAADDVIQFQAGFGTFLTFNVDLGASVRTMGTLVLNEFNNPVVFNNGVLQMLTTAGPATIDLQTAPAAGVVINADVLLSSNTNINTVATKKLTVNGGISGSASLKKTGAGELVLASGANGWTGGTVIEGGTVSLTASTLGSGTLTFSGAGGVLRSTTVINFMNNVSVASGASATFAAATGSEFILDNSLTVANGSQVHFGSASDAGTISFYAGTSGTGGSVFMDGGTFRVVGPTNVYINYLLSNASSFAMANSATFDLNNSPVSTREFTGSGIVNSSGGATTLTVQAKSNGGVFSGFIQDGPGAGVVTLKVNFDSNRDWTLSSFNSFSGGLTLSGMGTLKVGSAGAVGTGTILFGETATSQAALLNSLVSGSINNAIVLNTDGGIAAASGTVLTLGGTGFNWAGGSKFFSFGDGYTYTGNTGTIVFSKTAAVNVAAGSQVYVSGTLKAGNAFGLNALLTGATGGLAMTAGSTLDLNGFNLGVNKLEGIGVITNSGASATVLTQLSGNGIFGGVIQNGTSAIGLTVSGGSSLSLTGANTYSGTTTITAGTLKGGAANTFSAASAVAIAAASALDIGGFNQSIGALSGAGIVSNTGAASATLTQTNAAATTFSGVIKNTGGSLAFTKAGAGVLTLTGGNTYSGATTITAGTLKGGAANTFSAASAVAIAAASTLDIGGFDQSVGALSGAGIVNNSGAASATLRQTNAAATTFSGVIQNTGAILFFEKAGAGVLTLTGVQTYTGITTIFAGTLALSGAGSIATSGSANGPSGQYLYISPGATFDISQISAGATSILDLINSGSGSVLLGGKTLNVTAAWGNQGLGTINATAGTAALGFTQAADATDVNLSGLAFTGWNDASNTIAITGRAAANDSLTGSSRADTINAGGGNDTLTGGAGADTLNGGDGDDVLIGGAVAAAFTNQLNGDAGSDTASYAGTNVQVYADLNTNAGFLGAGVVLTDLYTSIENLIGGNVADTLNGNAFANRLDGGAGAFDDLLFGSDGNDTLIGGGHAALSFNQLFGGNGIDTADYSAESGKVFVDLRAPAGHIDNGGGFILNDLMNSIENAIGGSNDDILVGTDADNNLLVGNGGNDLLFGFDGNDTLIGGGAAGVLYNQIYGGNGNDTASYAGTTFAVSADLNVFAGYVKNSGGTFVLTDVYNSIENLTGGSVADTLVGDTGANILTGGAGADFLYANYNNVTPTVHDAAVDMFVYNSGSESTLGSGYDQIINFTSGQDKLDFRALNINAGSVTLNNNGGSWTVYANTDGVGGLGNNDLAILVQSATFVMSDIVFV